MEAVALGTKATFVLDPTEDEMKKYISVKHKINLKSVESRQLTAEEKSEASEALRNVENAKPMQMKKTAGDASESGLIKFV